MTSKTLQVAAVAATIMCATVTAWAQPAPGPKARLFAKYDTNKNGAIDGDEIAALRKAFAAEPKGELARFDANANGKLDDEEIAEIKPPGAGGKKGEKKQGGGKKKADGEAKEGEKPKEKEKEAAKN